MRNPNARIALIFLALSTLTMDVGHAEELRLPEHTFLTGSVEVPLDLSTGRPTVEVMFGDQGPYTLILDTGSGVTMLDRTLVQKLGLPTQGKEEITSPMQGGTPLQVDQVTIPHLALGGARFESVPALVLEEEFHLAGVQGVLAITVFREITAILDFGNNTLTLTRQHLDAVQLESSVSCASEELHIIEADMECSDFRVRGHIDTGSPGGISIPGSMADALSFAAPAVVVGRGGTLDASFEIRSAPYRGTVVVAGVDFVDPTLAIIDPLPTINVGTAALRGMRLHIDGPAQRLLLEHSPTSHSTTSGTPATASEPRRVVRRSGAGSGAPFGLMGVPGPDALTVNQVTEGSRAEKTGLRAGDRITAIDGTAFASISQNEIRNKLGRAGATLTVIRDDETITLTVQ